uniref:Phytosulfokine n=1 Tax=Avicennia marina TaxID=82927 RepID=Q5IVZ8_AVIMR|nr:phytosulfokine precursor [Avicennia marina]
MSKAKAIFIVALLLLFSLCSAARPTPTVGDKVEANNEVKTEGARVEENCQGLGEEECLMRRTLNAHLDYIYTQHHKP